jgi:hypothetical protein
MRTAVNLLNGGTKVSIAPFVIHTMTAIGRTWIVVLDDSRARFLRHDESGKWTEAAKEIPSAAAGAFSPEIRRAAREQFIRKVMTAVDGACDRNACDGIVTVGPERLLRTFRKAATDRVRVRLWRERAGEVSFMTDDEIAKSVEQYFRGNKT